MAWLESRWLERKERDELFEVYNEYFMGIIFPTYGYEHPENWPIEARERWPVYSRLERVKRCEGNLLEFSLEYFSEARNLGNDGNWEGFDLTRVEDAPTFHREITDIMNDVSMREINAKVAVAAPRSHAKSTYLSKAFPIHEVVYRLRKYIITISETPAVSKANMEWIRNQLKFNKKLREDFGPLLSPKDQANIRDNGEGFIAWHQDGEERKQIALVEAASTGQALRGRNWNGSRPDLVICDDLEDARPGGNASTPEQRQSLRDWFAQTVMPLGDPKGKRTAFVYMGTTVHYDSLLMHVLYKRSDFKTKIYRAILEPPERQDLWEQCRLLYSDREDPDRLSRATAFFNENKTEMLRGSQVLWPEVQPLWKLMTWKWDNGSKAFNTEYMNNPVDEESMIFNPETFTYWDDKDVNRTFSHAEYNIYMGVDFAMGKQKGDYSATTIIARHKQNGLIYVIDSYVKRVKPDEYMRDLCELVMKWQPDRIGAEAQMAQEFFVDQLKQHLQAIGYPAFKRVEKIQQRTRKELRIEAMLPDIETGKIQFCRRHALLLEQFERYGTGEHDDGPDSLAMALSTTKKAKIRIIDKPNWL